MSPALVGRREEPKYQVLSSNRLQKLWNWYVNYIYSGMLNVENIWFDSGVLMVFIKKSISSVNRKCSLCKHTFVPRHICAQIRLCPHTFVPRHVCSHSHLSPHTFVSRHIWAHTRLCPDTFVPRHDFAYLIVHIHDCAQTH